jgi:hypothetical protein
VLESDLSSLTAEPLNDTPTVNQRLTNFYLASRWPLVADDDDNEEKRWSRRKYFDRDIIGPCAVFRYGRIVPK